MSKALLFSKQAVPSPTMDVIQGNEGRAPEKVELMEKGVCKVEAEEEIPKGPIVFTLSRDNALQSSSYNPKRRKVNDLPANNKDGLKPCSAMARAIKFQAALSPQFPSMIKGMLHSHVTRGFWLGLNSLFCAKHLPREDTMMVLEDEDGRCYMSKYLAGKLGLSAGWRGFSIAHKLLVGDVVVFQLVTPTKFKVYISRDNQREVVEGALNILTLNADTKQTLAVNRGFAKEGNEDCESQLLLGLSAQEKNCTDDDSIKGSNSDQSEHDNGELEFDLGAGGIRFCESSIDFNKGRAPEKVELVAKRVCKVEPEEIPKGPLVFTLSRDNALQSSSFNPKRRKVNDLPASNNDGLKPCSAMARAIKVQAALSPQFPSMIKGMLHSHVTIGFWLGLNSLFCAKHLPREDTMMVLEDEDGRCYMSKYLAGKPGLSAGWRGFAIAHKLLVGDVVVFQLVTPTKFKVYISRDNQREVVEGALNILTLNADTKQTLAVNRGSRKEGTEDWESQLLLGLSAQEKNSTDDDRIKGCNSDQSVHDNGELEFDLGAGGIRFCESSIDFNEVKSFRQFGIHANGLVITCELSTHLQRKYYDLCCSQKCFLHQHLVEGLNVKLIAGIIMETVNIADAIQASKLTTSHDDFLAWKRTLQGFEGMGMDVGFIILRLDQLISLTDKSKGSEEVRTERCSALDELNSLEGKTLEMKEKVRSLNEEIMTLEEKGGSQLELMYQELARQIGRPR